MDIKDRLKAIADALDIASKHLRMFSDEIEDCNKNESVLPDDAALGKILKQYLSETNQTYRMFAKKIGVTSGYISMLVNNKNPKSGKPIRPTIETYNKIANAIGITASELLEWEQNFSIHDKSVQHGCYWDLSRKTIPSSQSQGTNCTENEMSERESVASKSIKLSF